jgi:glycosyltransferase involved in cell wall biosynthesis
MVQDSKHRERPIRVCMVVHNVYARDARVRRYAEYLAADGCLVDVICLASEDRGEQTLDPRIRVFPISMRRIRQEGWKQALEWAVSGFLMFWLACKLDLRYRYDLVHVHNMPDFLVFCAVLPRLRGCPVILDIHDPIPELAMSKLGLSPSHPAIRLLALIERACAWFSSHVITAVSTFKEKLVARGTLPEKITVIMNAADPRIFAPVTARKEQNRHRDRTSWVVLYVGTVARRYGLDVCVRALPLLKKSIPGVRLQVVPKVREEGLALEELLFLADSLGVRSLVHVSDPVPLEAMPQVMRQADVGVYPARRDCHMDLALSLKIPEMAQMGLPMVATRLTVLEELFGEHAIAFVPPEDSEALADKIVELYRSPDLSRRFAENASRCARSLAWETQYERYRALLRRFVGSAFS